MYAWNMLTRKILAGQFTRTWIWAVLAAALSYTAACVALCHTPLTTDEQSYLFQAHTFLSGHIKLEPPPFAAVFEHVMIILDDHAGWLSRYPPGHAAWLVPGIIIGDPWLIIAVGAGLGLLALTRAAFLMNANRTIAMFFLLFSPFFILNHGTLLSHTTGFLSTSLLLLFYCLWERSGKARFAFLGGLAWSWLFLTRTYTGLLIGVPFGIAALIALFRDRRMLGGCVAFAAAAAAGVVIQCIYNYQAVGAPFTMTYLYYDPREMLGFNESHTLKKGLINLADNVRLLDRWLWGFPLSLAAWFALSLFGWNLKNIVILAGPIVAMWIGYIFFYYPGPHEVGPAYYLETLPFMIISAALGATSLIARFFRRRAGLCRMLVVIGAVLISFGSVRFMVRQTFALRAELAERCALQKFLRHAPPRSLIFIDELFVDRSAFDYKDYACFNPLGLKSDPLVVDSMQGADKTVARYFSDRKPFSLDSRQGFKLIPLDMQRPLEIFIAADNSPMTTGHHELSAGTAPPVVRVAREGKDGEGTLTFGRYFHILPGQYSALFDVVISNGIPQKTTAIFDIAAEHGRKILSSRELAYSFYSGIYTMNFSAAQYEEIEPRIHYTGCGSITLKSIRILGLP